MQFTPEMNFYQFLSNCLPHYQKEELLIVNDILINSSINSLQKIQYYSQPPEIHNTDWILLKRSALIYNDEIHKYLMQECRLSQVKLSDILELRQWFHENGINSMHELINSPYAMYKIQEIKNPKGIYII